MPITQTKRQLLYQDGNYDCPFASFFRHGTYNSTAYTIGLFSSGNNSLGAVYCVLVPRDSPPPAVVPLILAFGSECEPTVNSTAAFRKWLTVDDW